MSFAKDLPTINMIGWIKWINIEYLVSWLKYSQEWRCHNSFPAEIFGWEWATDQNLIKFVSYQKLYTGISFTNTVQPTAECKNIIKLNMLKAVNEFEVDFIDKSLSNKYIHQKMHKKKQGKTNWRKM